jgi:hypothetical protein
VAIALDAWAGSGMWLKALSALKEFLTHAPESVPALLRLVEVAVESDADASASWAQAKLVDAYLRLGNADAALPVAQDLADREPSNPDHQERVVRALAIIEDLQQARAV